MKKIILLLTLVATLAFSFATLAQNVPKSVSKPLDSKEDLSRKNITGLSVDTLRLKYHYINKDLSDNNNAHSQLDSSLREYQDCKNAYEKYRKEASKSEFTNVDIISESIRLITNESLQESIIYEMSNYKPKNLVKYGIDTATLVSGFPLYVCSKGNQFYHIRLNDFDKFYNQDKNEFADFMRTSRGKPIIGRNDMLTNALSDDFNSARIKNKLTLTFVSAQSDVIKGLTLIGNPFIYKNMRNVAFQRQNRANELERLHLIRMTDDYSYWGSKTEGCCFEVSNFNQSTDNKFVPNGLGYILTFSSSKTGIFEYKRHALIEVPSKSTIAKNVGNGKFLMLGTMDDVKVYQAWIYDYTKNLNYTYFVKYNNWSTYDVMKAKIPSRFTWDNAQVLSEGTFAIYSRGQGLRDEGNQENTQAEGLFFGFNGGEFKGRVFFDPENPSNAKIGGIKMARGIYSKIENGSRVDYKGEFGLFGLSKMRYNIKPVGYTEVKKGGTYGVSSEYWENGAFVMSRADRESLLYAERLKREKEAFEEYEQERKRAEIYAEALKEQRKVKTLLNSGAYDYEIDKSVQDFFAASLLRGGNADISMIENEIKRIETEVLYRDLSKSEEQYFLKVFEGKMNILLGLLNGANTSSKGTAKSTPRGSSGGNSVCQACNGRGQLACQTCQGKGKYTCTSCNGRGNQGGSFSHVKCYHCHMGIEKCKKCYGDGYDQCNTCRGTGKL